MQRIKKASSKLLLLLVLTLIFFSAGALSAQAKTEKLYIPGGMPFGAKVYSDGLIVSALSDPAALGLRENPAVCGGVRIGDIIKKADNVQIKTPESLSGCVSRCEGKEMKLTVMRAKDEIVLTVKPQKCSDGEYRLGVNVRDSLAGIGTVTFISAEYGAFGGLGHGICDIGSGEVIPILRGSVAEVKINSIVKGESGRPGEIRGAFMHGKSGTLLKNTECGVFGIIGKVPADVQPMQAAELQEVKAGEAHIMCTLDGEGVKSYKIEIEKIDGDASHTTKNFQIKVTDRELLEKTNGIVQGMSGSPIIQNGKIVGAVTHVMINEPTKGYGIYIGNMLKEVPEILS